MKIFDFSKGERGKQLDDQWISKLGAPNIRRSDGTMAHVSIHQRNTTYTLAEFAGHETPERTVFWVTMDDLESKMGTQAVCFCEYHRGVFTWRFLATRSWLNKNKALLIQQQPH